MTPRTSAPGGPARHAAPGRRGKPLAVVVAVLGIGVGTWVLGSGPDAAPAAPEGAATVAGVPEVPVDQQAPALSVAPAPSAEAYAAARRANERASRDRAGGKDPAARKKAVQGTGTDASATGAAAAIR